MNNSNMKVNVGDRWLYLFEKIIVEATKCKENTSEGTLLCCHNSSRGYHKVGDKEDDWTFATNNYYGWKKLIGQEAEKE